jgi:hypothetical protein
MVPYPVCMEGVANRGRVVWPAPPVQAQSNVQGHCCEATVSPSCIKAQDAYDELNCVGGKASPCNGACLQLRLTE